MNHEKFNPTAWTENIRVRVGMMVVLDGKYFRSRTGKNSLPIDGNLDWIFEGTVNQSGGDNFVPLAGTEVGSPLTGPIEVVNDAYFDVLTQKNPGDENYFNNRIAFGADDGITIQSQSDAPFPMQSSFSLSPGVARASCNTNLTEFSEDSIRVTYCLRNISWDASQEFLLGARVETDYKAQIFLKDTGNETYPNQSFYLNGNIEEGFEVNSTFEDEQSKIIANWHQIDLLSENAASDENSKLSIFADGANYDRLLKFKNEDDSKEIQESQIGYSKISGFNTFRFQSATTALNDFPNRIVETTFNAEEGVNLVYQNLDDGTDNQIRLRDNEMLLTGNKGISLSTGAANFNFTETEFIVDIAEPGSRGITSGVDYTANITDLDFVQKKYVDENTHAHDQDLNIGSNVQFNQVKSQVDSWKIGQQDDYKAELYLADGSNSVFPGKSFLIRGNIADGFSTQNYSASGGGNMEVNSAGASLNYYPAAGGSFQLKITSAGILGQAYYAPAGDFHFVQKKYVDDKVASVYKIKGSVANFAALPSSGQASGDVWNLISTGENYVWVLDLNNTGLPGWDKFSGVVDLSGYLPYNGATANLNAGVYMGSFNGVNVGQNTGGFKGFGSSTPFAFLSLLNAAQQVLAGGILASDNYSDVSLIPASGGYFKGPINTLNKGTSANWYDAYLWGDHRQHNPSVTQYLGANYTGGGDVTPVGGFGQGRLQLQMVYGTNLPGAGLGADYQNVLYLSSYQGSDPSASKSIAIVSSMATNNIGFTKQSTGDTTWGAYIPFWTGANFDPTTKADVRNYTTSEVDTGANWIDGKPVYQKTLELTVIPSNGIVDITALVPNIKLIAEAKVFTDWGIRDIAFAGQVYKVSEVNDITISITPYEVTIYDSVVDTGYEDITKITITLEYTKTTD